MTAPDITACPVIAAVKNEAQLENALRSECEVVFLLFGDLLNVTELTERVREAGKFPVVHEQTAQKTCQQRPGGQSGE